MSSAQEYFSLLRKSLWVFTWLLLQPCVSSISLKTQVCFINYQHCYHCNIDLQTWGLSTIVLEKMTCLCTISLPHSSPSSDHNWITPHHCHSFFRPLANSWGLVKMLQAKVPFWSFQTFTKWFEFIHWTELILDHVSFCVCLIDF